MPPIIPSYKNIQINFFFTEFNVPGLFRLAVIAQKLIITWPGMADQHLNLTIPNIYYVFLLYRSNFPPNIMSLVFCSAYVKLCTIIKYAYVIHRHY